MIFTPFNFPAILYLLQQALQQAAAVDWTPVITGIVSAIASVALAVVAIKRDWLKLRSKLNLSAAEVLASQNTLHTDSIYQRLEKLETERDSLTAVIAEERLKVAILRREKTAHRTASSGIRRRLRKALYASPSLDEASTKKARELLNLWVSFDRGIIEDVWSELDYKDNDKPKATSSPPKTARGFDLS